MATSKKKSTPAKAAKKAAKAAPAEAPAAADPAPAEAAPEAEAAPTSEPMRFDREDPKRSDDEAKQIRLVLKKAEKAIEQVNEVLDMFEPAPDRSVKNALKRLMQELEALKPPEPRKCKEFKRALALARKGEMGIHPDDIMKYCRCAECHELREKAGLSHPPAPRAAS